MVSSTEALPSRPLLPSPQNGGQAVALAVAGELARSALDAAQAAAVLNCLLGEEAKQQLQLQLAAGLGLGQHAQMAAHHWGGEACAAGGALVQLGAGSPTGPLMPNCW